MARAITALYRGNVMIHTFSITEKTARRTRWRVLNRAFAAVRTLLPVFYGAHTHMSENRHNKCVSAVHMC